MPALKIRPCFLISAYPRQAIIRAEPCTTGRNYDNPNLVPGACYFSLDNSWCTSINFRADWRSKRRTAVRSFISLLAFVITLSIGSLAAKPKTPKKPPCHPSLSLCPDFGCFEEDSPEGWENILKHHRPDGEVPLTLTIADFVTLQKQTDQRFSDSSQFGNRLGCP